MGRWMNVCIDDGWIERWMDRLKKGRWMNVCIDDGWMEGWMDRLKDGQMDECMYR